jgi:hypothetical protein
MRAAFHRSHPRWLGRVVSDGVVAGLVAAVLSGLPSTAIASARGQDPLESTRALGRIALPAERSALRLVLAAAPLHLGLSLGWGVILAAVLPRRRTVAWGAVAGLGIAALDLGLARRMFSSIRDLEVPPQVADHVAFGVVVGAVVARRRPIASPTRSDRPGARGPGPGAAGAGA